MKIYTIWCFCTNLIFGKILFPEIWAKIFSAIQVVGFFNQPYLKDKSMKHPDFLHVYTNLHKSWSKIFWVGMVKNGSGGSGYGTLNWLSQERIDGINWFFACWYKFRKAKSNFTSFWVGLVKNGPGHLVHETLKPAE